MMLPDDFTRLLRPRGLTRQWRADGLLELAYKQKYYVRGLRAVLAKHHVAADVVLPNWNDKDIQRDVFLHIPDVWKRDIPDRHKTKRAAKKAAESPEWNSFWQWIAKTQFTRAMDGEPQSLPKALSSIAAAHYALSARGIVWDPLDPDSSAYIAPSFYWAESFDTTVYNLLYPNNEVGRSQLKETYALLGLVFSPNPVHEYKTVMEMASKFTATFHTVAMLKLHLRFDRHRNIGAINRMWPGPGQNKIGMALERFSR